MRCCAARRDPTCGSTPCSTSAFTTRWSWSRWRTGRRPSAASATTLELRRRTGAVQVAVVRDGQPIYRRAPDFRYRAGDTVVLVGDPDCLGRALPLFRAGEAAEIRGDPISSSTGA